MQRKLEAFQTAGFTCSEEKFDKTSFVNSRKQMSKF